MSAVRSRRGLAVGLALVLVALGVTWWAVDDGDRPDGAVVALLPEDACGTLVARPGGGWWSCTLAEDFDGDALDHDLWRPDVSKGSATQACMLDHPRTLRVADGMLNLTVQPVDETLTCPVRPDGTSSAYASGSITTYYRFSQQYGRFEARMMSQDAAQPGLQEAFWLWPDVRYTTLLPHPQSGEIDIAETYSDHPNIAVPFLHYGIDDNGGPVPGLNTAWHCQAPRGEFHTYTLEWSADAVAIYVDGKLCLRNTDGAPSFRKRFIVCVSQLLGIKDNAYIGATGPVAELPATLVVDYVRVWQ